MRDDMKQYSAVFAAALSISLMAPALAQQANSPVGEPMNQSARASATMEEKGLIATDMRPRFRTYVTTQAQTAEYCFISSLICCAPAR